MHEKSLKTLEFDKIVRQLAGLSFSVNGKRRCETISPSSDLSLVRVRQCETADALQQINDKGLPPMSGLHDVRQGVRRAQTGASLTADYLLKVAAFLRAITKLKNAVPGEAEYVDNSFSKLMRQLVPIPALEEEITRCIIGPEEIADRASPELFTIREEIRRTQRSIRRTLDDLLRSKAHALQEVLITMRDGRYVLPVKVSHRGEVQGIVHDASASGQTLFIEPSAVISANNKIRELEAAEREEIERILAALSALTAEQAELIFENSELAAEIDFILARARLAKQMRAAEPILNENGEIDLIQARHPLIDDNEVVPIDLRLGKEYQTLIVTGPNTGGKTVSLKTCGLLSLMAMAGLHVPCAYGSKLSVFKNVMADIGDEQSIEQSLSTFSSHMKNIVSITNAASEGVLVLTDELGSGTDPVEGAALAIAILNFLKERGAITMATSHYKELKLYALDTPGVENASCEFDVDTLMPTYRLLIGVPGVSNAFIIAGKLGLNKSIIRAAKEELTSEALAFEEVIAKIETDRAAAADLRREAENEKITIMHERNRLENKLRKLKEDEQKVLTKAREEARDKLGRQLAETEALLKKLRLAGARVDADEAERLRHELKHQVKTVEGAIGSQTLNARENLPSVGQIEIGKTYLNKKLGINGKVEQGPDSSGQYLFRSGALTLWLKPNDLSPALREENSGSAKANRRTRRAGQVAGERRVSKAQSFVPEIKLIGLTADEAADRLDRYLDDAVLAGAKSLRIVHGKGQGILRDMVRQNLKRDRRISSFREGAYGEGDAGVTIAELK